MNKVELVKEICKYFWRELALIVASVIFLLFLNNLNNELLSTFNENDYIKILSYDNGKPLIFFGITCLLAFGASLVVIFRLNEIRLNEIDFSEFICSFIGMILMIILIIVLICFINNPILQAILGLSVTVVVFTKGS